MRVMLLPIGFHYKVNPWTPVPVLITSWAGFTCPCCCGAALIIDDMTRTLEDQKSIKMRIPILFWVQFGSVAHLIKYRT